MSTKMNIKCLKICNLSICIISKRKSDYQRVSTEEVRFNSKYTFIIITIYIDWLCSKILYNVNATGM